MVTAMDVYPDHYDLSRSERDEAMTWGARHAEVDFVAIRHDSVAVHVPQLGGVAGLTVVHPRIEGRTLIATLEAAWAAVPAA